MPEAATDEKLIDVLQFISKERNIPFEMLIEALEAALLTAYKRHFGSEANAIVTVDRQTGEYKVFHRRSVVAEVTDPKLEVTPKEAGPQYQVGDFFDEEVTPKDFGRIAAQTAKQVIVQRIREAERDTVYNKYAAKLNDIVKGTVQRFEQRNMYVLLDGKDEAMLPLSEQVPRENFRINDFIRAYVLDVRKSPKGPSVILSRAAEGLVQRLLEFEVPEIEDGIVEIMAIAREWGDVKPEAKKTSIHLLRTATAFAGIATRKDALVLTLKSENDIRSPRVRKHEPASPGRWHIEIKLTKPQEVDHELQQWLRASYLLAK